MNTIGSMVDTTHESSAQEPEQEQHNVSPILWYDFQKDMFPSSVIAIFFTFIWLVGWLVVGGECMSVVHTQKKKRKKMIPLDAETIFTDQSV